MTRDAKGKGARVQGAKGAENTGSPAERPVGKAPFIAALILALIGVGLSAYLIDVHQKAHDPNAPPLGCDISAVWQCGDIARSAWSTIFGVPTAAWGLLTYAGLALLAVAGIRRKVFPKGSGGLILLGAIGATLFGGFLVYVMHLEGKWCINCLGLDAVHLGLLISALLAVRGRGAVKAVGEDLATIAQNKPAAIGIIGGPVLAGILVLLAYPGGASQGGGADQDGGPSVPEGLCFMPPRGEISLEGVPSQGEDNALITILEFSDYQCPYCLAAHEEVREVLDESEGRIRFYHFHYPLDMACNPAIRRPFHRHACLASSAALCAQDQGRFWQLNDLLFEHGRELDPDMLPRLVEEAGGLDEEELMRCVRSERTRERILHDLEQGAQLPVEGTPAFVINGRVVSGFRPGMYRTILGELLENEGRWPERYQCSDRQRAGEGQGH